jgi:hypothetical protein
MGTLALVSTDGDVTYLTAATSGVAKVAEQGNIAAVANAGSTSNAYVQNREFYNFGIIATTVAQTLGSAAANDTHLRGISLSTALTAAVSITGFGSASGTSAMTWTIPAGQPKGFVDFFGAINAVGPLTVTLGGTADIGIVAAHWRPI